MHAQIIQINIVQRVYNVRAYQNEVTTSVSERGDYFCNLLTISSLVMRCVDFFTRFMRSWIFLDQSSKMSLGFLLLANCIMPLRRLILAETVFFTTSLDRNSSVSCMSVMNALQGKCKINWCYAEILMQYKTMKKSSEVNVWLKRSQHRWVNRLK